MGACEFNWYSYMSLASINNIINNKPVIIRTNQSSNDRSQTSVIAKLQSRSGNYVFSSFLLHLER